LPGATHFENYANSVSADGSVIVGHGAFGTSGIPHATRWTAAGVQDLGIPTGYVNSLAFAVSDDGTIVGGLSDVTGGRVAWVWTSGAGRELLADRLAATGVSVPAQLRLESVLAISGDGLTFAGQALNLSTGTREGFVATVPTPPASLLLLLLPALRRRR